ncbi:hypothetical protein NT6N_35850 [Oceaniferula spumae]|uniref:Ice-binding protein C-terminal domain-containing protein n=1 Tax=Oceaniferula spumae TaxID=2979115 RepID=A0AAT9FR84_9BACT
MKIQLIIVALATSSLPMSAATVVNYSAGVAPTTGTTGASDPVTQGWSANGGATAFSHGLDSSNGGWRITDGTTQQPYFYQQAISVSDAAAMAAGDWSATWTMTVNADAVNSGGGGVDEYYASPNNGRQNNNAMWIEVSSSFRYILTYNVDANNDIQITDGTNTFQISTANNQLSQEIGASFANHVTYTLSSSGGVVSLSDSLNGLHGVVATSGAATQDRVLWGATSSGGQGSTTWNSVNVQTVPEPTSSMLLGMAGVLLILRRKK